MHRFDDLWEQAELSRREVIASGAATGFVAGFALSVQPVMAQTMILTDAASLTAGMVDIPTSTGPIPAYRAAPDGAGIDYRPSYREAAARDGWQRLLDWLRRHGVA